MMMLTYYNKKQNLRFLIRLVNTVWETLNSISNVDCGVIITPVDWIGDVCFFQSQFLLRECMAVSSKIVSVMLEFGKWKNDAS